MNFLIFWLGTSALSFCMEMAQELRMYKDAADHGYKIDSKRLSEFSKQLNPNSTKNTMFSMLIPLVNMMLVMQRTMEYNNNRVYIMDQLRAMDALEEMSEYEKREYAKKPTGLNAFLVPLKLQLKMAKSNISIKINGENGYSKIFFEIGKESSDITILKVTGEASKWTVEQQKQAVFDVLRKMAEGFNKKYGGDVNALKNDLTNGKVLDFNEKKDTESVELQGENNQKLNECEEKKKELELLRSSLVNGQENFDNKEKTRILRK